MRLDAECRAGEDAAKRLIARLKGRETLSPADFRDIESSVRDAAENLTVRGTGPGAGFLFTLALAAIGVDIDAKG